MSSHFFSFFFFNDTATTEIYTLSLHDALPICGCTGRRAVPAGERPLGDVGDLAVRAVAGDDQRRLARPQHRDRKSTRLNSSHSSISYAVFCLKKKKKKKNKNKENKRKHKN